MKIWSIVQETPPNASHSVATPATAARLADRFRPATRATDQSVFALASTSSMPPTLRNACSGMLSYSPLAIASKGSMV
jgi:hypothetical protein